MMNMKKINSLTSLKRKEAMSGRIFVLPFYLGFILFSAKPLIETMLMVFNDVKINFGGYKMTSVGFDNLFYIFNVDADFTQNLFTAVSNMLWQVPVVLILSLILAQIINADFIGRTFVRSVLFVPVIVMTGTVVLIIQNDVVASAALNGGVVAGGKVEYSVGLEGLLNETGLNSAAIELFTKIANNMFNLLWKTGVQIVIFLAGLQSISPSLYEASSIEGATRWETFFKIDLPIMMPIITINTVYTIVDFFTDPNNEAMNQVILAINDLKFGRAAAMSWSYFILIGIFVFVVMFVLSKINKKYS